ncbi:MAG: LysM peptidoglycan-binding domain-containing protein [Bacteroidales bacterium]|nr:LysM peptidoglycan-binding domain-containing protein [Bacteroidales bacterium]
MKITVERRQTLSDIAIQVYGDVRAVGILMVENGVSLTDDLEPGTVLECPEAEYDRYLQMYVVRRGIRPATALDPDGEIRAKVFTQEFTEEFK